MANVKAHHQEFNRKVCEALDLKNCTYFKLWAGVGEIPRVEATMFVTVEQLDRLAEVVRQYKVEPLLMSNGEPWSEATGKLGPYKPKETTDERIDVTQQG
jgi:hypothetical protein